ncbi:MAG TPA: VacJ family lipoprotein [Gammaproteobacteria bacterium]|nr:VacJ family lipoprotein [Gammaproteobacteria bacterium]
MRTDLFFGSVLLCVVTASAHAVVNSDSSDPYQDFNRHMFALNDSLDKAILKPVATLYQTVVPSVARKGVTHVFANLDEIPTIVNDGLQGQGHQMGRDSERFAVNTTAGVGGLFDVASDMGIQKHYEDFGLTLAKWGYAQSSYLVLPFFGPSTVRDTAGLPVDYVTSIYPYLPQNVSIPVYALEVTNTRTNLLTYNGVYAQAFDPYVFVRNAYMQRRDAKIEGNTASGVYAKTGRGGEGNLFQDKS